MRAILDNIFKRPKRKEAYIVNGSSLTVVQTDSDELFIYLIKSSTPDEALIHQFTDDFFHQFNTSKSIHSAIDIKDYINSNYCVVSKDRIDEVFSYIEKIVWN